MDNIWEVPEKKFAKINVHCIIAPEPLPNGNSVAVGVIVRNDGGAELWKALGPMNGLNEEQAIMAGLQAACVQAVKKDWEKIHIETTNRDVYDAIRVQNHFGIQEDQLEVYRLFNTLYTNHFKEGSTVVCVSWAPAHMNSTAEYLASYGMRNLTCFAEAKSRVGDLDFFLERDMGRVLPAPINELALNMGEGEVIDGPPPNPAKKRRVNVEYGAGNSSSAVHHSLNAGCVSAMVNKGKRKFYEGMAFNNGGIFSPSAIRIMEEGELGEFSGIFQQKVVDFNGPVKKGLRACDLLHHAAAGTLNEVKPTRMELLDELLFGGREFVSVDEVLHALGLSRKKALNLTIPATSSSVPLFP
ncbi:hypothetical protein DCAR_0209155 [Daucus carota subsp. sativus]|uniref:RNase H type-1 domain-containing protein n=1 Tax=Daucus carota subsp. sativus TaxID=79200 RepID=A0A166F2N6_DAUCS|nr:hypothetical protein DCAR_0209155 [Daucus carota subsp. sativus]